MVVWSGRGGVGGALTPVECARIRVLRVDGLRIREIVEAVGVSKQSVLRVLGEAGPMPKSRVVCCRLSLRVREEIRVGLVEGLSFAAIGERVGFHRSSVSREVRNNGGRDGYLAFAAEAAAQVRAKRCRRSKLEKNPLLAERVRDGLERRWSPLAIAERLRADFGDDESMWISHETIYQQIFVSVRGNGVLGKEANDYLRSRRKKRQPPARSKKALRDEGRFKDMVSIDDRPAEVEDRELPGHWEGDLIVGPYNRSAIITLVERASRFALLIQTGPEHGAKTVRKAIAAKMVDLPTDLKLSLTWDQGSEMAEHIKFKVDTNIDVYFCHPHSPWERGSNENFNRSLRDYLPKGTDLSTIPQNRLDEIAAELNDRPRRVLDWKKPAEILPQLVH